MTEWNVVSIVVALVFAAAKVPALGDCAGRLVLGEPKDAPAPGAEGPGGAGAGAPRPG
jgi:Sec-independent protein translocase protein TatA